MRNQQPENRYSQRRVALWCAIYTSVPAWLNVRQLCVATLKSRAAFICRSRHMNSICTTTSIFVASTIRSEYYP